MDTRAQRRLMVLTHVLAGELELPEAAAVLGRSVRQVRRLLERYRADGAVAFVHGNRGRVPVNRLDDAIRAQIVELATTTYAGFNPVHLAETLAEEVGLVLSARTLRRVLVAAGVPQVRRQAAQEAPQPARADAARGHAPPGRRQPPRLARGPWADPDPRRRDR